MTKVWPSALCNDQGQVRVIVSGIDRPSGVELKLHCKAIWLYGLPLLCRSLLKKKNQASDHLNEFTSKNKDVDWVLLLTVKVS
jgi:hypothetical protein